MVERLKRILDSYQLTPGSFADSLGVQRSGLSHILNGRNKPSLDFIIKVLDNYPEIDPDWLLTGKGVMNRETDPMKKRVLASEPSIFDVLNQNTSQPQIMPDVTAVNSDQSPSGKNVDNEEKQPDADLPVHMPTSPKVPEIQATEDQKSEVFVDQIYIFYSDMTFDVYKPRKRR